MVNRRAGFLLCHNDLHDSGVEHLHRVSRIDLMDHALMRLMHLLCDAVVLVPLFLVINHISLLLFIGVNDDGARLEPDETQA